MQDFVKDTKKLLRSKDKEIKALEIDMQQVERDHEAACANLIREMDADRRDELVRLAAEREQERQRAEQLARVAEAQRAATERLRAARNASNLERQAALEQENALLKQRRSMKKRT